MTILSRIIGVPVLFIGIGLAPLVVLVALGVSAWGTWWANVEGAS